MPHADFSLVPESIKSKGEFWEHVYSQLAPLLEGQRNWISNLANSSALIFNALRSFPAHFGNNDKAVNWCGFYIDSQLFPKPRGAIAPDAGVTDGPKRLLLAPFCGKPACQFINIFPTPRGVCSGAFIQRQTLLVPDVDQYPGHIACDGETKSEIVIPLIVKREDGKEEAVGVLDLDCLAVGGFDDEDKAGLEKIAKLVVSSCDW
ncbi:Free methionine-R-sulfoxide reductase [Hypsizygus marmoreus]|uniref:Free methionine-R-sulfoxide reductase n=1 Tax=Hypsizygus marmoreus TaxID=39966 RepID=A0A369K3K9_HYPMA|nr:Free methionine-R-sulfoxide reductase [Hypsizygus marmoreus]